MTETDTRETVEAYVERYNEHDLAGLLELFADEIEQDGETHDKAELTGAFTVWLNAFPDIELQPDQLVVEDDRASLSFTVSGTHEGSFLGTEPTRESVAFDEVLLFRVEDGQITRFDAVWDQLGLFTQIGLIEHPLE